MSTYLGIDVGTASVRASAIGVNNNEVKLLAQKVVPITIWNEQPDHFEQSSEQIWSAVAQAVRLVILELDLKAEDVAGIGFDATCSLVVLDSEMKPLTVSCSSEINRNVIMWMDHRAKEEMQQINATNHEMLRYVGGTISLEMEMPKILWIKKNLPKTWEKVGALMDLPDFLTFKATAHDSRSLCSLVCKWAYDASAGSLTDHGWNESFLQLIGLEELVGDRFKKLGMTVLAPGQPVGSGLSDVSAAELGLNPGTPVGASLIDAHAGGVGMLTCSSEGLKNIPLTSKIGLICGTSTCHMAISKDPLFVPGVWGPYFSAMIPGLWLNEGGQSATGKVIDYIIETHPAYKELNQVEDVYSHLAHRAKTIAQSKKVPLQVLTRELHVWPDFHGNRSPLADPTLKGMISGLTLGTSVDDLAVLYIAALQSLVYGTRHTIETLEKNGHDIQIVLICGGLTKNSLFLQMTADILDKPVVIPNESESVLIGAAMLGVCAHRDEPLDVVLQRVHCSGSMLRPDLTNIDYHNKKYQVFRKMVVDQQEYREIMAKQ